MQNDITQTDTDTLERMAATLKQDAQDLWNAGIRTESMRLFRLFRAIAQELHTRRNPANAHRWN